MSGLRAVGTSRRFLTLVLALLTAAAAFVYTAPAASSITRPVKVMTRNLYLGADLTPALLAQTPGEAALAAGEIYAAVQATDFPQRAVSLAYEIHDADPDVIGLQEVALWRTGAFLNPYPATTVVYDFLDSLIAELDALGLDYDAVVVQEEADIEAPAVPQFMDVRLTQRDVILVKGDLPSEISWSNPASANFITNLVIPNPVLGPITVLRGWTSVDLVVNKREFRFINTHLEAFDPFQGGLRLAQTWEILAGPAATDRVVVLVGDLNSGPHDLLLSDSWDFLVGFAGFVDAWDAANPGAPGYTCCQAADLLNPAPLLDERIDHVLTRPGVPVGNVKLVGNDQDNRTVGGLWPSDHSGMVATLQP